MYVHTLYISFQSQMTCNFEFLMSKAYPISDVVFCIYVSSLLSYNSIPEHSFRERNRYRILD